MRRGKAKIILSVDLINHMHIQNRKTTNEAWDSLQTAFKDSGLTRILGLLRTLIMTQLDNFSGVAEDINNITLTAFH